MIRISSGSTRLPTLRRSESGAALVELAITFPILLMLVFAIVEYAVMFGAMVVMNNTVNEVARATTVYRSDFSTAQYASFAESRLRQALPTYVGDFKTNVSPSVSTEACGDSVCVKVRLSYPDYRANPLVNNFLLVPLPARLDAEATTRIEPTDA